MEMRFLNALILVFMFLQLGCAENALHSGAHASRKDAQSEQDSSHLEQVSPHLAFRSEADSGGLFDAKSRYSVSLSPADDVAAIFRRLCAEGKVQYIVFEPGVYYITDTLHLPRTGGLVVIEGRGAALRTNAEIPIFYSLPANQEQAMVYNKTRYLIQNFSQIQGGNKGVFLGSSFNTVIRNIEFIGQREAAVDLIFCLMCSLEQLLVTNPFHDGIVLRSGVEHASRVNAWPGTTFNNSQCNHSVLRSCRVYNRKGCTGSSFVALQSTGIRLLDCISEGWENARAVFFDAADCTTAKYFSIQNFHLEHAPRDGGLVFRSFGSTVEVDGFFTQKANAEAPTIWLMNNGTYIFRNVPWWPEAAWVKSSHAPRVTIAQSDKRFYDFDNSWLNAERPGQPIFKGYLHTP